MMRARETTGSCGLQHREKIEARRFSGNHDARIHGNEKVLQLRVHQF